MTKIESLKYVIKNKGYCNKCKKNNCYYYKFHKCRFINMILLYYAHYSKNGDIYDIYNKILGLAQLLYDKNILKSINKINSIFDEETF